MIETTIYQRLQDSVASLVGGSGGAFSSSFSSAFDIGTDGRVFTLAPTINLSALPCVVFTINSTDPSLSLDGPTGQRRYSFTVDCISVFQDELEEVADAVLEGLHGWRDLDRGVLYCHQIDGSETLLDEKTRVYNLSFSLVGIPV